MTQENTVTGYTVTPDAEPAELQTAAQPENTATLGVVDLNNAAQIIDIAVSRGAFRANEVAQVGAVYNKLASFVLSVQEQQKAAGENTAE